MKQANELETLELTEKELVDYNDIRNSSAWRSMEVLRRARDGNNCASFDTNHVDYFMQKGLILPDNNYIIHGFYKITKRGLKFLGKYAEDFIKSQA
ncbi:MAG: hypothetical protein IPL74_05645 [Bacteroidetes bacterium]|nr:hypothetical protein [Bacteroidota bacterium]